MALAFFTGFESGGAEEFVTTLSAGASIQTTIKRTGDYALRCNPSAQAARVALADISSTTGKINSSAGWGTTIYISLYIRVATLPSGASVFLRAGGSTSGTTVIEATIDNTGAIKLYDRTNSSSSAGTVTADGNWHLIKLKVVRNGTCEISVDGGSVQTLTGLNQAISFFYLGSRVDNVTYDIYYDDVAIDTAAYVTNPEVYRMDVDGNTSDTSWTGSYTDVDENPHDSGTTTISSATSGQLEGVTYESASSAGINVTAKSVHAYMVMTDGAFNAGTKFAIQEGGTTTELSSATTSSGAVYVHGGMIKDTNPRTSSAWTTSDLDGIATRVNRTATGGSDLVTAMYVMVLVEGSSPPSGTIAATMAKATFSGSGSQTQTGTVVATLSKATASLTGTQTQTGTIVAAIQKVLMSASGNQEGIPVEGELEATLQKTLASLTGYMQPEGTIVATTLATLFASSGIQSQIGELVAETQLATFAASGSQTQVGNIAAVLQSVLFDADGTQTQTGTIQATIQKVVAALTGVMLPEGTIAASTQNVVFNSTAQVIFSGQLAATLQRVSFSALAFQLYLAEINATIQKVLFSAQGVEVPEGVIAANVQKALFSGSGLQSQIGIITITIPKTTFSGSGTVTLILTVPALAQIEGVTRNEIFKRFLRETGLGTYGIVTGVAGGATTTLDDTTRLKSSQFNTDAWKGAWVRISKNDNANGTAPEGDISPITAYDPITNGRLTFSPAVTGNIAAADEYEIWRFPSPAFVIDDLDTVLREDIFLPCWSVLSEAPDFDMEQNNIVDWNAYNAATLSKVSGEPSLDGARWLAVTSTSGAVGGAYNGNEISVQPNTKYFVSVVCYNQVGVTCTLEAYDATNSATIDSRSWSGRFPGRIHFEFTTPSTCKSLRIYLKHSSGSGTLVSKWDELCLYPSGATDIALPWWVKNANQIKGIFRLTPSDIDTDVWDATLKGEFYNQFEIRDNAFGRGQLRLITKGTLPYPLFIFGVRNETAYDDDNTDIKRIDENLIIAALATKVFRRLKTFPNSSAMQTTWVEKQYEDWEARYKQLSRQQSTRVEAITQSYRATGQFLDPRFALNR